MEKLTRKMKWEHIAAAVAVIGIGFSLLLGKKCLDYYREKKKKEARETEDDELVERLIPADEEIPPHVGFNHEAHSVPVYHPLG